MKYLFQFFALLLFILFARCSPDKKVAESLADFEKQQLLDSVGLNTQNFEIDNTRDTTLFGKKGSIISIDSDCFQHATGPINIELIEAFDLNEIVLLNAQTKSNGKILSTDGVLYINAKVNDVEVKLKQGKAIQIEIPSVNRDQNMKAFVGKKDTIGAMNWKEGNEMIWSTTREVSQITQYKFFTIPLDLFPQRGEYEKMNAMGKKYPITESGIFAPITEHLMGQPKRDFYTKILTLINNKKNVNTPLATEEFAERLKEIAWYYVIYYDRPTAAIPEYKFIKNPFEKIQLELFNIYADNIDKPLHYSDSLTVLKLLEFKRQNDDTHSDKRLDDLIELFKTFENEKLSYPILIENYGVDLNNKNAYRFLIKKGIDKDKARLSIALFNTRQEIIKRLQNDISEEKNYLRTVAKAEKEKEDALKVEYYLIQANQLGWINVDKFYSSPKAQEVELLAKFNTPTDVDFFNVSLVLPSQKSYLTGYITKEGFYQFTEEKKYYTKLPVGELAYLVGISYKNGKPILGMKKITIGQNKLEEVTASTTELDDFKAKLNKLN